MEKRRTHPDDAGSPWRVRVYRRGMYVLRRVKGSSGLKTLGSFKYIPSPVFPESKASFESAFKKSFAENLPLGIDARRRKVRARISGWMTPCVAKGFCAQAAE
jgi:hypothetical protein